MATDDSSAVGEEHSDALSSLLCCWVDAILTARDDDDCC